MPSFDEVQRKGEGLSFMFPIIGLPKISIMPKWCVYVCVPFNLHMVNNMHLKCTA